MVLEHDDNQGDTKTETPFGLKHSHSNEDESQEARKALADVIESLDEKTRAEIDKLSVEDLVGILKKDRDNSKRTD